MPYQTNYFSFFNNNFQYLNIKNYYLKILTKQRKRVFIFYPIASASPYVWMGEIAVALGLFLSCLVHFDKYKY